MRAPDLELEHGQVAVAWSRSASSAASARKKRSAEGTKRRSGEDAKMHAVTGTRANGVGGTTLGGAAHELCGKMRDGVVARDEGSTSVRV